jgi:hypothetical protein
MEENDETDVIDKIEIGDYSFNPLDYEGYSGINFGNLKPQKPVKPSKPPRQSRPMREQ